MADNFNIYESKFSRVADNIPGAEGPVFDKNGNFYMVAPGIKKNDELAGQIVKVNLSNGKVDEVCSPCVNGKGGLPCGLQCDKCGNIWVADMWQGILKVNPNSGKYKQICKVDSEGRAMQGCNDCSFDYDGNLWVTAPGGQIAPEPFKLNMFQKPPIGSLYCLTKDEKVIRVDTGLWFPNGIAVQHTPDGRPKTLIVAETGPGTLLAYDIFGPGKLGPKRLWAKLPTENGRRLGGPDGIDFDEAGNLLVANHGGSHIDVFGPNGGQAHTRIKCPFSKPSNLHFKQGTNTVYVSEHSNKALWKFEWIRPGQPQYCDITDSKL